MTRFAQRLLDTPPKARVVPFAIFLILTAFQGKADPASQFWIYFLKTLIGAWLVFEARSAIPEMRWKISTPAIAAGILVFVAWVGLDPFYPGISRLTGALSGKTAAPAPPEWNPFLFFGENSAPAWFFCAVRLVGSTLVVPPIEEAFYRSFVYRYLSRPDFEAAPLGRFRPAPFIITCVIFGLAHDQWLAGIFCGAVYQALVCWKGRLGDAMTAHAVTNFLLGAWVIWKGAWNFW